MNSAYNNLNSLINQFTKAAAAAQKVMMLSDTMPDVVTKHTANTDKAIELHGAIDIEELAFVYQMRPEKQILHGVNLHVPPATTCAFVGRSGGGKVSRTYQLRRTQPQPPQYNHTAVRADASQPMLPACGLLLAGWLCCVRVP